MLSPERTPQIPFRSTRSAGPPGINAEFIQALQKKGLVLNIEGIRVLRGGETGLAHGTYTSKYADPNMTPGEGNWVQTFERDGDGWNIAAHASSRSALASQMK